MVCIYVINSIMSTHICSAYCANKNENKWKREEEVNPYETEKNVWTESFFLQKETTFLLHHTFLACCFRETHKVNKVV